MADRIFKCENQEIQRVFCCILNQVFGIKTSKYNATEAPFILVNLDKRMIMEVRVEVMRWKAHTLVTQEYVEAMMLMPYPPALAAFLFK